MRYEELNELLERQNTYVGDEEIKSTTSYKIKIYQFGSVVAERESENIEAVLQWFKIYWKHAYENLECAFEVYENDEKLKFDDVDKLGFYE